MAASEAQIRANQQNSLKSTGPKTSEGKAQSRQNAWKHGMAGSGVVVSAGESAAVELRAEALRSELAPRSALGEILVQQLATLSVRMERGAKHEFASVAAKVRHASEDFDAERVARAEALFATLAEAPRPVLRKLRKLPEGVDQLIEAWSELRFQLTRESQPGWTREQLRTAANLSGLAEVELSGTRLDALGRANWGDFSGLPEAERFARDQVEAGKAWARTRLLERVDQAIAELEAHDATLDHDTIEQDRAEAGDRALFDPSRAASLARRYESEARRAFFKALDQFRQVEAEAEATEPAEKPAERTPQLASSRENRVVTPRDPQPTEPILSRAPRCAEPIRPEPRNRRPVDTRMAVGVG